MDRLLEECRQKREAEIVVLIGNRRNICNLNYSHHFQTYEHRYLKFIIKFWPLASSADFTFIVKHET